MLADPKAEALVENFAGQWLQLRNLQNVLPDPVEFPNFDDNLRNAFATRDRAVLRQRQRARTAASSTC